MIKKIAMMAVAAGLLVGPLAGTSVAAPANHHAALAACDGSSCYGLDPQAAGCAGDGETVASITQYGVLLELRYSPSCHANWARITPAPANWHFWVENTYGDRQDYTLPSTNYSTAWTYMVNGYPAAQACQETGCTAWK